MCGGCVGAVTRLLNKVEGKATWRGAEYTLPRLSLTPPYITGVESIDTSIEEKKVTVHGSATQEACIAALTQWATKGEKELGPWVEE